MSEKELPTIFLQKSCEGVIVGKTVAQMSASEIAEMKKDIFEEISWRLLFNCGGPNISEEIQTKIGGAVGEGIANWIAKQKEQGNG